MFKKLLLTAALGLFGFLGASHAQTVNGFDGSKIYWYPLNSTTLQSTPTGAIPYFGTPTGSCLPNQYAINATNGSIYQCSGGFWSLTSSGSGGGPGGVTGQLQVNNGGGTFAGISLGGDCSFLTPNITCTKTNGFLFAPSATIDTTNAGLISSGNLAEARAPSATVFTDQSATFGAHTYDFSGVTLMKARVGAGLTTTVNGDFGFDTTNKNWHMWANGVDNYVILLPVASSVANGDCANFTVVSSVIRLGSAGSGCGTGGGGSAFNAITSGTNSTAAMLVGTGASLGTSGSGTIAATTAASASKWTTARSLAGNSVDGSANVPFANAFIAGGTSDSGLSGAFFLGSLATGLLKVTTTTGALTDGASSDVIGLFSGTCDSTHALFGDGSCKNTGTGTVTSSTQYQIAVFPTSSTTVQGGPSVPATKGVFFPVYSPNTDAASALTTLQSGLGGRAISGATSTDTVLFSDNVTVINHDVAASSSVTETLPTPTTLENTSFGYAYENDSTHVDTITPTTWTINGAASLSVPVNTKAVIKVDPFNATNWLAILTPTTVVNLVTQTSVPTANQICVYGSTAKVCTPTTTLPTAAEPAHTGDCTNSSGSLALTCLPLVSKDTTTPITVSTTASAGFYNNQNATAGTAVTYNLPTAAAGKQFCFTNSYNGSAADTGVLTIATSASGQFVIFTDGTLSATGGNVTSGGAAADATCMVGVDSTHWQMYVQRGTWTKH